MYNGTCICKSLKWERFILQKPPSYVGGCWFKSWVGSLCAVCMLSLYYCFLLFFFYYRSKTCMLGWLETLSWQWACGCFSLWWSGCTPVQGVPLIFPSGSWDRLQLLWPWVGLKRVFKMDQDRESVPEQSGGIMLTLASKAFLQCLMILFLETFVHSFSKKAFSSEKCLICASLLTSVHRLIRLPSKYLDSCSLH